MMIDEYSILKKKQKKNAFAATALLISIAIALLVMVGAVLILSKVNDNDRVTSRVDNSAAEKDNNDSTTCEGLVKEIVFNDNLKTIKEAAIAYFTNERLPQTIGDTVRISLGSMQEKKLVLNIRDASANLCYREKSYVEVTKEKDEYIMKIFLSCSDLEDYIIVHLGCYDYCDKDVCEKKEEPEEIFEYEYKKTTSCVMGDWSSWGSWKTTREKTSNLKKEDIKVETTTKETVDKIKATASKTTYNCNNYSGYTLVDTNKCVKTETVNATKAKDEYNCNGYTGYTLSGNKCIKNETKRDTVNAAKNEATYSCPKGYTRSVIKYTVKKGDTIASVAKANNISESALKLANNLTSNTLTVGQKLTIPVEYQTKCYTSVTRTDSKEAKVTTPIYGTRYVTSTCYDTVCSIKLVPSCTNGYCEMEEIRVCDKVPRTCKISQQYIIGYNYSCSDYGSNYTLTDDHRCVYTYPDKEYKSATKNADTYNCNSYPGYTLSGSQCYKDIPVYDEKPANVVLGGYSCNTSDGYKLEGTKCVKKTTKNADKNPTKYTCTVSGYTLTKDNMCVKTITTGTKVTYYRYATRTCDGGKTYTEWSLDKNDTALLNEGYKPTGVKRAYQEVIK